MKRCMRKWIQKKNILESEMWVHKHEPSILTPYPLPMPVVSVSQRDLYEEWDKNKLVIRIHYVAAMLLEMGILGYAS